MLGEKNAKIKNSVSNKSEDQARHYIFTGKSLVITYVRDKNKTRTAIES